MKTVLNIHLTVLLLAALCQATIIDVPDEVRTIQGAITAAQHGDTILVQPGIYGENINYSGKNIIIGSHFLTTSDTNFISATIIDGHDRGSVVKFQYGEDERAALIGFTIQNGTSREGAGIFSSNCSPRLEHLIVKSNFAERYGGGIYINHSHSNVSHVIVEDNFAYRIGGGIYCSGNESQVSITDVIIRNNHADNRGGGFACDAYGTASLVSCNVKNNSTDDMGGGIFTNESELSLFNVTVDSNRARYEGGGLYLEDDSVIRISYCLISDNSSEGSGGGLACAHNTDAILNHVVFTRNIARYGGGMSCFHESDPVLVNVTIVGNINNERRYCGGFSARYACHPVLVNTLIWNNGEKAIVFEPLQRRETPSHIIVAYCDVEGGLDSIRIGGSGDVDWQEGNINIDPLFVDLDSSDFHLTEDSPCIDAGTALFIIGNDTLLNLLPDEYGGDAPDIGAFEFGFIPERIESKRYYLDEFALLQNYPNPFNALTIVTFTLPHRADIKLKLYDVDGREVAILADGFCPVGRNREVIDGQHLSAGIYFVRLSALDRNSICKVVLIK